MLRIFSLFSWAYSFLLAFPLETRRRAVSACLFGTVKPSKSKRCALTSPTRCVRLLGHGGQACLEHDMLCTTLALTVLLQDLRRRRLGWRQLFRIRQLQNLWLFIAASIRLFVSLLGCCAGWAC